MKFRKFAFYINYDKNRLIGIVGWALNLNNHMHLNYISYNSCRYRYIQDIKISSQFVQILRRWQYLRHNTLGCSIIIILFHVKNRKIRPNEEKLANDQNLQSP